MEINIRAFGIARDIMGGSLSSMVIEEGATVKILLQQLKEKYADLGGLTSVLIAVNEEYADMDYVLSSTDEVVIIPPVSGG